MTAPRTLEFGGTNEELEKYLVEFARLVGGWTARDPKRQGYVLSAGALLSTNPNTLPWRAWIAREDGRLTLQSRAPALGWSRAKAGRIAAFREGQLADYLTARVRGSGPEKFDPVRLRLPFAPFGSGIAAVTASFSWSVLTTIAILLFSLLFTTLASVPLMGTSIGRIQAHAQALEQAGAIPLPSAGEIGAIGPGFALGTALVFAVPLAFFFGTIHALAVAASDLFPRAARAPQASFVFQAILILLAFYPFLSITALLAAVMAPTGAHLGASLVWARRRERIREGPKPPPQVVIIAVALAASLAGAVMPRASDEKFLDRVALFRDRWLLGHPVGKAIASNYYRHTLYTAEPLKELYSSDPERPRRSRPVALVSDPHQVAQARALGFVTTSDGPSDVTIGDRVIVGHDSVDLPRGDDLQELKKALDEVSRRTFRGGSLREVCGLSWRALFYAGPPVALLIAMGAFAPGVSLLFRRLAPRTAALALFGVFVVASCVLVLAGLGEENGTYLLADLSPARRHVAAYRAYRLDSTAGLADGLVRTADDPDVRVRLWACAALGKSGDPRAFGKLVERLDDPELFVRYRAAEGLGLLGDARAVEPLVRMMRTRSWYEGTYALEALRRLRPGQF